MTPSPSFPDGLTPSPQRRKAAGFTLAEIAIAIGLFSFCIVLIIWLMGTSLTSSRDSQEDTSFAGILRDLDHRVRSLPEPQLSQQQTFFYSHTGIRTTDAATAAYRATLEPLAPFGAIPHSPRLFLWSAAIEPVIEHPTQRTCRTILSRVLYRSMPEGDEDDD